MRALKFILELLFWLVAAGTLLFGGAVLIGISFAPVFGILGIVAVLLLFPVTLGIATNSRGRRSAMVLSYLEQAVRLNLPLPRMLWAAQQSEPGKSAIRLMNLRQRMEDGIPIGAALDMSVPEVPDRAVGIITAAERVGRLPQALLRLRQERELVGRREGMDTVFFRIYPPLMFLVTSLVMSMIAIFVLPKFQTIFSDFGIKLPAITMRTFEIAYVLGPIIGILVVATILWNGARALWETFHPERSQGSIRQVVVQYALWWLPITHALERDRGLTDVCEALADAFEAGMPADRAIAQAGLLRVNAVLRARVLRWARDVSDGASIHEAARSAGMPGLVVGMLSAARQGEDAANVLRFLARYYRSRFSRLSAVVRGAAIPLTVLAFGVIVGLVTLSLFTPMINMIDRVATQSRLYPL
jgi:type IV pilus assembly protein PilC